MTQTYQYQKKNTSPLFFVLLILYVIVLKFLLLADTPVVSFIFILSFIIGGFILYFFTDWIIYKASFVEIDDLTISRKLLFYSVWSVPVLSVTDIAQGMGSIAGWTGPRQSPAAPNGFILKANNKFYTIPYNLKSPDDFIKVLKSKNSNIKTSEELSVNGLFMGNDLVRQYNQKYGVIYKILLPLGTLLAAMVILAYIFSKYGGQ